ncbi:PREDICTED: uncharacterized protein LOC108546010 [Eufriesea mexicana]|uniref:uncharacterized protein LOC108546010 n=1 Tax=Eufriesea mexicana TaxID=516756 RepID=UPI00083BE3C0|nr:PREDICTED: uncharacterized protein LOC108546010 [Eufriesea mexicana]
MSSLIVMHDSRMVLLEVAVQNLYMPWTDVFDAALMKKTVIMFRMLDDEWTTLFPNRRDYRVYRGSNYETEYFYGGRSVLFSIPETTLEETMSGVDLQLYVYKGISKYFELQPRRNFGFTLVRVDDLFNGIIKDLCERKELEGYFSSALEREPISRSTRGTFPLLDEDMQKTDATIELYVRISYLGKCIITEVYTPLSIQTAFYAREETDDHYQYQFRQLNNMDLESFCWGSRTIIPPLHPDLLICRCKELETPVEEATQTKKKKKRKRDDLDFRNKLARVQELLALMKELRKNRPDTIAQGAKAKSVCPPSPRVCPAVCPPVCVYTMPSVCPNPCQTAVCCLPSACMNAT